MKPWLETAIVIHTKDRYKRNLSHHIRHNVKCVTIRNVLYRINTRRCISIIHLKRVLYPIEILPFYKRTIGKHLVFITWLFPFDSESLVSGNF